MLKMGLHAGFIGASATGLREAPLIFCLQVQMGIARMGGVSTLARMVWGTYLEMFKWAFAWLWGGQDACQDGLGHFKCSEN